MNGDDDTSASASTSGAVGVPHGLTFAQAERVLRILEEGPEGDASNAVVESPADPLPTVPGYRFVRILGGGAEGTVYEAVRDGSPRRLAVKVLRHRLGDGPAATRAWRELDILSQVHLPCVPRVIDYGVVDGRMFITSDYVEGKAIDVHAEGLSRRERAELLASVCDAVQLLHEYGVLHRDLKPSNILVDRAGRPVVIDLGISRLVDGEAMVTVTTAGVPLGSPAFMAPEQARGERVARSRVSAGPAPEAGGPAVGAVEPGEEWMGVSTRSDVYSLGAIGYAVLTGSTPHDTGASLHEVIRRVGQDAARDPRVLDPTIPAPLAAVLRKACEHAAQRRYASASALADDLRRWARGEAVSAGPASVLVRSTRWVGRHPVIATSAICVAIVLLAMAIFFGTVRWYYEADPSHAIVTSHEPWEVRIVSDSGRIVARWPTTKQNPPTQPTHVVATRAARPGPWDDEVFLIRAGDGVLRAWSKTDFETPLWSIPDERVPLVPPAYPAVDNLNQRLSPKAHGDFNMGIPILDDIFPDRPGDELLVAFSCQEHPACIRVYDLGGNVLFECWHMGIVADVQWLAESRVIIAAALHGRRSWQMQGFVPASIWTRWPDAVLALRPREGVRAGWILDGTMHDEAIDLVWYRFLVGPAVLSRGFGLAAMHPPRDPAVARETVVLELGPATGEPPYALLAWTVDSDGHRRSAIEHDAMKECAWADEVRSDVALVDELPRAPGPPGSLRGAP